MNKHFFSALFSLGALALLWVAAGFFPGHLLALAVTLVIATVYGFGALELLRFRQATASLNRALAVIPEGLSELGSWLAGVHPALQNAVRLRIEGERVALPGPALTPYLVGLLVMLGMLGTFLGMVVTLNGAVFALDGSPDLAAIRSAFATPIKGLGLAFGTSVAGVASSAILGLLSALCRRERLQAAQLLDSTIATQLRGFSLTHQRQQTYQALQLQSQALPAVVTQLQALMQQMERMGQQMNERLLSNQESFHGSVSGVYTALARSVDQSLRDSLAHSAQIAGDSIKPMVEAALGGIAGEARLLHERLLAGTQEQLQALSTRLNTSAAGVAEHWTAALGAHERANTQMVATVGQSLEAFDARFAQRAQALLLAVKDAYGQQQAEHADQDSQRLQAWRASLESMATGLHNEWQHSSAQALAQQQRVCSTLAETAQQIGDTLNATAQHMGSTLGTTAQQMDSRLTQTAQHIGSTLSETAQQIGNTLGETAKQIGHTLGTTVQQVDASLTQTAQQLGSTLEHSAEQLGTQAQHSASNTLAEVTRLLARSEELVRTRIATEAEWTAQQGTRMAQLATVLQTELGALRSAEAQRGQAAVDRLAELQAALTAHLTTLGTALEDPITRLIATASEAPRAAAEVIGQLRQEISSSVARDNAVLEERSRIMETLNTLLAGINHASLEQRAVIDALVASSGVSLTQAGAQFAAKVDAEADKLSGIAAQVTGSAVEVSTLGESFGFAVQSFNAGNEKLMASLQRIEAALDKSMARSDEQLAYYVAQAREVIDLSTMSQKEIVEALRQLSRQQAQAAAEAA